MVSTSLVAGLITLAQGRVSAGATAKVAKGAEKAKADSALDQVKAQARADRKTRIGDAKDQARARVQRLIEQMKLLKKLYADDPKKMAKALAEAAKELQGAVKDYAAASARKTLEDEAKAEAAGDMDFIKLVRGLGADLKDLLLTARTKAALTMKEKFEETDDYKDAEKGLKDLGKSVDDLDQQVRSDMPPGSLMTLAA